MAQAAMTIRLDNRIKTQFDSLCEQFGMSANAAINVFINEGMPQQERLHKLNQIAIQQMRVLEIEASRKMLTE